MHLKFMIFGLMICLAWPLCSQYQLGMRLERNAGVYGLDINPALGNVHSKKWDIQLASASFFLENNYMFLKETDMMRILRNTKNFIVVERKISNKENVFEVGYSDFSTAKFLYSQAVISGPALGYRINENHFFGTFFQSKGTLSIKASPYKEYYNVLQEKRYLELFSGSPFREMFINLLEIGINYGYTYNYSSNDQICFGINLKYLKGLNMIFSNIHNSAKHNIIDRNIIELPHPSLTFGYTTFENFFKDLKGSGVGTDLGITFIKNKNDNDYDYKIGLSLLNIGTVNFNIKTASYKFSSDSSIQINIKDFEKLNSGDAIEEVVDIFLQNSIGNKPTLNVYTNQPIYLPFTISAQFDYKVSPSLYLNAILMQPLSVGTIRLNGIQLLALTPRYEHKWFSISMPISMIEGKSFHLGLGGRLAYLSFGSDNILSIIRKGDFYGSDFYAGIKVGFDPKKSPFKNRRSKVKCYTF